VAQAHASAYRAAFPGESAQDEVLRNVGKALAAYERAMRVRQDALDAYAHGSRDAMTFLQKQGLSMFLQLGCAQCHWGPRLTDDAFHVTRTGTGDGSGAPDPGRGGRTGAEDAAMVGAFETPSLRGVAAGGPFGHGGAHKTVTDVLLAYGSGGLPPDDPRSAGRRDPWLPRFGETAQWSIAAFLAVLRSEPRVP
jgi:cytochrome c peroxidase